MEVTNALFVLVTYIHRLVLLDLTYWCLILTLQLSQPILMRLLCSSNSRRAFVCLCIVTRRTRPYAAAKRHIPLLRQLDINRSCFAYDVYSTLQQLP